MIKKDSPMGVLLSIVYIPCFTLLCIAALASLISLIMGFFTAGLSLLFSIPCCVVVVITGKICEEIEKITEWDLLDPKSISAGRIAVDSAFMGAIAGGFFGFLFGPIGWVAMAIFSLKGIFFGLEKKEILEKEERKQHREEESKNEVASSMLDDGESIAKICEYTGLDESEVIDLDSKNKKEIAFVMLKNGESNTKIFERTGFNDEQVKDLESEREALALSMLVDSKSTTEICDKTGLSEEKIKILEFRNKEEMAFSMLEDGESIDKIRVATGLTENQVKVLDSKKQEIVFVMLENGESIDKICKHTGLNEEQVKILESVRKAV